MLIAGSDPTLAARLADNLASQGIDVRRAEEPFKVGTRQMPAGAYLVSNAQPSGRLLRNLLEADIKQPEAFVKEQDRRRKKRLGDQIYDVTAWSLPALFDVDVVTSPQALTCKSTPVVPGRTAPRRACRRRRSPTCCRGAPAPRPPWPSAMAEGVKVRQASEPFTIAGRGYPAGTAIVRVAETATRWPRRSGASRRHTAPRSSRSTPAGSTTASRWDPATSCR